MDGKAQAVPVETGLITPDTAEIMSGLEAGDVVIASDVSRLQVGDTVNARQTGSP